MNLSLSDLENLDSSEDAFKSDLIILVVLEIIICITFLIGTILNTILVILFFKRRGFRTLSNR